MASIKSPIRSFLKPLLFKLIGKKGYFLMQYVAKKKDIEQQLVEEPEMVLLPVFITPESNVIDIGANYAYFTHRFANICTKGHVYAFEPIPFTYNVAKKIIESCRFKNVRIYQLGVGNENIQTVFEVPLQSFGAYSAGQAHLSGRDNELNGKEQHYKFSSHEKVNCKIIRLDDFKDIDKPIDFIKIDIEGAELFALKGMKDLLIKSKPVILLEINPFFLEGFKIKESELKEFIKGLDYSTFIYNMLTKKLENYTSDYIESNYILIPASKLSKYQGLIA